MDLGLNNKVVLVTGAAGGIGRPTAEGLAREGARVVCVDLDEAEASILAEKLPGTGHVGLGAELLGQESADLLVAGVLNMFGRIDALVHLAALLQTIELADVSEDAWDDHMRVNVNAPFFLARNVAESMVEREIEGRLVLATSGAWLSGGLPTRLPYATTKGAVTTMVRGLAKAYGPYGITANTVAPGLIDTPMMRSGLTDSARIDLEQATPLRRFGRPEEIAAVNIFLCSAQASFISGATINASGGNTLY